MIIWTADLSISGIFNNAELTRGILLACCFSPKHPDAWLVAHARESTVCCAHSCMQSQLMSITA